MKKSILFLLLVSTLFTSCASLLNGKYQKVAVSSINQSSIVHIDGKKESTGKTPTIKLKRDGVVKQIYVKTEGYKDVNYVHYQSKKSPLYIMSWVPFGVFIFPILSDYGYKSYDFEKVATFKEKVISIPVKNENEKYLFVKNTSFNLKENDLTFKSVKRKNYDKKNNKKAKVTDKNSDGIKFDNSVFTDALNEILVNYKYTDTTNSIFKTNQNSSFISATIKKINVSNVYDYSCKEYINFSESQTEIEWEFLDIYGQTLYKKIINSTSGQFATAFYKEASVKESIYDAITSSFLNFINEKKVRELLTITNEKAVKLPVLNIPTGKTNTTLQDALNSTVTIKTKNGHGSGFVVSNNGYIVTNFHVVANEKENNIKVIDNFSNEYDVKIIRKNENFDLALLKIEKQFDKHFKLIDNKNYDVGQDIFVIGTPKTIELGQTITKGIISGERSKNNISYIQIDASVNGGNSGGPLVNKDGVLLGVVNAKLSGIGIEGIGFSIPAQKIKECLNISN